MRLFVAASLPAAVLSALDELQKSLRDRLGRIKWLRAEGIHLTLRFLGDVPSDRLVPLQEALRSALTRPGGPFELALSGIGVFPDWRRPRVLWVSLVDVASRPGGLASLNDLQKRVERGVVEAGFQPETRPFRPHLTLARFGREGKPGGLDDVLTGTDIPADTGFAVDRIGLIRSFLGPSGARYQTLEEYPL